MKAIIRYSKYKRGNTHTTQHTYNVQKDGESERAGK